MIKYENYVVLPSIAAVQRFVSVTNGFEDEIRVESEGYSVDAKSLIEMFVLNLEKEHRLIFKGAVQDCQKLIDMLKAADITVIHKGKDV